MKEGGGCGMLATIKKILMQRKDKEAEQEKVGESGITVDLSNPS